MIALNLQPPAVRGGSEHKAKRSSFYAALRILPPAQREAMFEIYGFCRDVDDIADDGGAREVRQAKLRQWRADIDALYRGQPTERTQSLVRPVEQFGLQRADFQAVIDGMEMDVSGTVNAPDLATLDLYCDRVASAVGRLSVRVFGMPEADGIALSHHLGRALQLTNILRDIDEDAAIGRLYLPQEALRVVGITSTDPQKVIADPAIGSACAPVIATAKQHFTEAGRIMARSPRKRVRTPMLMGKAYQVILEGLIRRGFSAPRIRVRVGKLTMAALVLRYGIW
jgi:presqualene diphosphate synthase